MRHQKSEMKSLITFKKAELFDQLLTSIEEEDSGIGDSLQGKPQWVVLINYNYGVDPWKYPGPILEEDKVSLTRFFRRDEHPRVIKNLGGCREWAMESRENWKRIIPEGRELILKCAQEHNDNQFLETVRKFETPGRKVGY